MKYYKILQKIHFFIDIPLRRQYNSIITAKALWGLALRRLFVFFYAVICIGSEF